MAHIGKFGSINMLTAGLLDGWVSIGEVVSSGEIGLGTFAGLDGEMVMLDGQVYRIGTDGSPRRVDSGTTTPFAVVGTFESPEIHEIENRDGWNALTATLDAHLANRNRPVLIRIDGRFPRTLARRVPAQHRPYPSLGEVCREQTVFELPAFDGTLVGFHFPDYLRALNVVGYHLHVIDDQRRYGGHVLDISIERATLRIETAARVEFMFPDDPSFREAILTADPHEEVQKAERG